MLNHHRSALRFWAFGLWAVVCLLGASSRSYAQGFGGPPGAHRPDATPAGVTPAQLEDIGIEDKSGASIPRDIGLTGSDGRTFKLGEYLDGERPLLLVLAYYGCPMLCSMVLNGTVDGLKGVEKLPGQDYRVLVVSFDPRDTTAIGHDKRAAYFQALQRPVAPIDGSELASFEFATGSEEEVRRLADAIGFRYRWDDTENQYAHAAGIFVLTPDAKLSTTLTGVQYPPQDITSALVDAQRGVWRSPLKSVLLFCFQYNPHTGKYNLIAGRAMRTGAALTIAAVIFFIWRMRRTEKREALRQLTKPKASELKPQELVQGQS